MTILQSILLGALQGIAEFLPVSSSGHLVVFRNFMSLGDVPVLFDIILHTATLAVVIIVFRKVIGEILVSLFRLITGKKRPEDTVNLRLVLVVLGASVFTAALGFFIEGLGFADKPKIVSVLFLFTALILILTRLIKTEGHGYDKIGPKTAVITGIAQGIAVFPGISRSGMTIAASLFSGISREKAAEYSFILSIPAIGGALLLELKDFGELTGDVSAGAIIAGWLSAFIVGYLSVLFLLSVIKKDKLHYFSFYLIPFAVISFFLL